MKRLLFLPVLLVLSLTVAAQRNKKETTEEEGGKKKSRQEEGSPEMQQPADKKYMDLMMYYMDGEYEKAYKKSLKVTEDEESSKDAMPFLYASMAIYEMSFIEQYKEDYPDALKDALKLAGKYRKKDEKNSQKQGLPYLEFWQDNKMYFDKLRKTTKDEAQKQLDANKASKAEGFYKLINNFDPEDYSTLYMMGTLRLEANDTANGGKFMREFDEQIKKIEGLTEEPEDRVALLKYAHFEYAKFLINAGRTDAAKEVIKHLELYTGKDPEITKFIEEKKL